MTDTTPTTPPADPNGITPPEGGTDERLSAEAGKWRKSAREAQAERDAARADLEQARADLDTAHAATNEQLEQARAEVRAEADSLRAQLDGMRRQLIADAARSIDLGVGQARQILLHDPTDLLALTEDVSTLMNDDGTEPDPRRVRAALNKLHSERRYLFSNEYYRGPARSIRDELARGIPNPDGRAHQAPKGGWDDALKGATKPQ